MKMAALLRVVAALLALVLIGSTPARAEPIAIRDDRGVEHRFERAPQRVITMLPSLTETAWVLGVGERLVGVDRYSNWPATIKALPHLGGLDDAQIEAIAALQPDVILASPASRAMERLEVLGFRVVRLRSESHADLRRTLDLVARLLGDAPSSQRVWAALQQQLSDAAAQVPARMRGQRVYFEIGGGPYAAGQQSFIGETLTRLGLANVVGRELGPFPKLNPEYIVRAQPQIIMGVRSELEGVQRRPGWARIPAVRDAQLCGFDDAQYDMMVRPSPRLGEAALLLADCLKRLDGRTTGAPAR